MRKAILSAGAGVGAARLAGIGISLVLTVVLARQLGPAGLGAFGYAVMILALLAAPVSNGWAILVLRQASSALHDGQWGPVRGMVVRGVQVAGLLTLALWAVAALLVWLLQSRLPPVWSIASVSLLALVLFLDQVSALRMSVLRGLNHPVWGQLPELLIRPALVVVCITALGFVLHRQLQVQYAFAALVLGATVSAVVGGIVLQKKAPAGLKAGAPAMNTRQWIRSASLLGANAGVVLTNSYVDVLVLGAFGSMEQVGIYRVAMQVSLFSGFAYTALNLVASQRFAYLRAAGDQAGLQATAAFLARVAFAGALPLPFIFALFGEEIVGFAFGAAFLPALGPMFVLFLNQGINAFTGMPRTVLVMSGKEGRLLPLSILSVLLNLGLSVALVPHHGATGAAAATTVAALVWNALVWRFALRETGVDASAWGMAGRARGEAE